jgi:hypothetical protein|tara:strand:- start:3700 stop:4113 length:414 start_codon:yes stop_codon:yes gene_type:complete
MKTPYNPTWVLSTYRTLDAQGSIEKPEGFPEFDPARDWCGPEDNPKISAMIPDAIMGVPIGVAGYRHDLGYATPKFMRRKWCKSKYIWRLLCDLRFKYDIITLLNCSALNKADLKMAKFFAKGYYWSVRFGGWKHCA